MNYVKEIDGLRAVAVLSVVLFHVQYEWLGGGFVGVDVFFVISGFLISRIILNELDAGTFSVARFYERRIRRIAPALIAMLIVCTGFLVVLPPAESTAIRNALFAALFSASNFWFHLTTDYFRDNSFNPLLHTWSLSVEEQFYVALPPLLWLASRYAPRWRRALIVLALIASAVAAEWVVRGNASAAFYLPWLRAWELLAGTLLATVPPAAIGPRLRIALSHLGLLAIAAACLLYEKTLRFPGLSAALPVLGSCAVIAGAGQPSPANWLLGTAPMRFIGKISYSMYLVHWPLVCLVATIYGLTPKAKPAIVLLSIGLAWLSWRFVESPFRHSSNDPAQRARLFRNFVGVLAAVSASFMLITAAGRSVWHQFPAAEAYTRYLDGMKAEFAQNPCWLEGGKVEVPVFLQSACMRVEPAKRNVLLIGDSHSAHLIRALRTALSGLNVLHASRANCTPYPHPSPQTDGICVALMDTVYGDWLPATDPALDTVILSARWQPGEIASLETAVRRIEAIGRKVIVFGPSPEFRAMVPLALAYESMLSRQFGAGLVKGESFELDAMLAHDPVIAPHYFSLIQRLCPDHVCVTGSDGVSYYYDRDHLTEAGARIALHDLAP